MTEVDAIGHLCPLPVLRARRALDRLKRGEQLTLLATDSGTWKDVPAFCRETGHKLVRAEKKDGVFVYMIEKNSETSNQP